jgi:hypothetical protein
VFLFLALRADMQSQVETVPVGHPVYVFLDRMEVQGLISRYHDAILPLDRREVGLFLSRISEQDSMLSTVEQERLGDFLSEFQYDIHGRVSDFRSIIPPGDSAGAIAGFAPFDDREHFLFLHADSTVTLFVNGLVTLDGRMISGDALGEEDAEFFQFGGSLRGSLLGSLGYALRGTNAQFWGSRELLVRDRHIQQAHTLSVLDTQNFDFAEGYVRYDADIVSIQLGRERMLWGSGLDQKMELSDNVRVFDFIRADASYKSFRYTFLHAWLLGQSSMLQYTLPGDTTVYTEPVNADKYFAAHRFTLAFPCVLDVGFQEMVIYSNRSPDLAYLNPLTFIESVQRSRGERDNVFWSFDVETHFLDGLELSGTLLFDDLHFDEFFEPKWYNRYAYQAGIQLSDPLLFPNLTLMAEYTRVEPFVFAHNRSREGSYTSLGAMLGPRIGPNADAWFVRADWYATRRVFISVRGEFTRSGENVYDGAGNLVKNVGGDPLQPHRPSDPEERIFLDGNRVNSVRVESDLAWEAANQLWLEGWYLFEKEERDEPDVTAIDHTLGLRVRLLF